MRCLAVLPVVVYHLMSRLCPGGFVGVDIFFVISGYLICGGIVRDLRNECYSLRSFYYRRIRRIFPAYFVLTCGVLIAGSGLFHWGKLVPLARTSLFSAFFSTNLYFWLDMGYFQPNAHDNPLLNLWSLGVEEHFYIVIPFALFLIWKIKRGLLLPAFVFLFLSSLAACILLGAHRQSTTAFYILPTRAWELLAGALLTLAPPPKRTLFSELLAFVGLALVLLSFWCLDTTRTFLSGGTSVEVIFPLIGSLGIHPFPGLVSTPVILGSCLLIRFGSSGIAGKLLCARPLVGIGKISYSLYLWHWPLLVFAAYATFDSPSTSILFAVFMASFAAAYASWRWVEMPFRLNRNFTPRHAFIGTAAASLILCAWSILLIQTDGLRRFIHRQANYYAPAPRSFLANFQKFVSEPSFRFTAYPQADENYFKLIGDPHEAPSFFLIGDSHGEALEPGLGSVASASHRAGYYVKQRYTMRSLEGEMANPQSVLNWVAGHPEIRDIYYCNRWLYSYEIRTAIPKLGDKGKIPPLHLDEATDRAIEGDARRLAQWFVDHGKRIWVFTCVPEYEYYPPDIMARSQIFPLHEPIDITKQDYLNRQLPITEIFSKLEKEGLVTVIPLGAGFLEDDHTVFMDQNGVQFYRDSSHVTEPGAILLCEKIAPLLWPSSLKTNQSETNASQKARP